MCLLFRAGRFPIRLVDPAFEAESPLSSSVGGASLRIVLSECGEVVVGRAFECGAKQTRSSTGKTVIKSRPLVSSSHDSHQARIHSLVSAAGVKVKGHSRSPFVEALDVASDVPDQYCKCMRLGGDALLSATDSHAVHRAPSPPTIACDEGVPSLFGDKMSTVKASTM